MREMSTTATLVSAQWKRGSALQDLLIQALRISWTSSKVLERNDGENNQICHSALADVALVLLFRDAPTKQDTSSEP